MLEYLESDMPSELAFYNDATLIAAASLIRRFRDLSAALIATLRYALRVIVQR